MLKQAIKQSQSDRQVRDLKARLKAATEHADLLEQQMKDLRAARRRPLALKAGKGNTRKRQRTDMVRVILSDTHGSAADPEALSAALGDVKHLDPDEVILMGDHVDCGGFLAQHHTLGYVAETAYTYEDDIAATNQFLDALQQAAPRASILYLEGNHEDRVERWAVTQALKSTRDAEMLRRLVSPHTLLNLEERGIEYARRSERHGDCTIPGWVKRGKCFFVHEISSAQNAARQALIKTGGNVVYGHTHREDSYSMDLPNVGRISAWCPGCLCQRQPLYRHTQPSGWTHGIGVQLVTKNERFLHFNVPIMKGESLLVSLLKSS